MAYNISSFIFQEFYLQLINQITNCQITTEKRPVAIYLNIDYNSTNMTENQIEYALMRFKSHIEEHFSALPTTHKILFSIIYGIVIIIGLLSNLLMIYAFYRAEKLRTFRNVFIINLAISDILLSLICAPLTLFRYIEFNWSLGRILCKIGPGLQTTNVMVIAFSITTIAIDRWQYISSLGKDKTKKIGLFACISIIWILGAFVAIPSFIVNDLKIFMLPDNETLYTACQEIWISDSHKYAYSITTTIFQYFIPLIIVTLTNLKICHYLYFKVPSIYSYTYKKKKQDTFNIKFGKSKNQNNANNNNVNNINANIIDNINQEKENTENNSVTIAQNKPDYVDPLLEVNTPITYFEITNVNTNGNNNNNNNNSNSNQLRQRNIYLSDGKFVVHDHERFSRSRYLLIAVCLSFALSWLPLLILNITLDFFSFHTEESTASYFLISHLIATLSTIINPIIYGLLNTNFKKEFVRIMTSCQL